MRDLRRLKNQPPPKEWGEFLCTDPLTERELLAAAKNVFPVSETGTTISKVVVLLLLGFFFKLIFTFLT